MGSHSFFSPQAIAEGGEKIYKEKYQSEYEPDHLGKFLAIDVISKSAFLGNTPEEALDVAESNEPRGLFHLVQIGHKSAFRVSSSTGVILDDEEELNKVTTASPTTEAPEENSPT